MTINLVHELNRLRRFSDKSLLNHAGGFRSCLVLAGSSQWCYLQAVNSLRVLLNRKQNAAKVFWLAESVDNSSLDQLQNSALSFDDPAFKQSLLTLNATIQLLKPSEAKTLLGVDTDYIVVDTRYGLSPDVLAMLLGSLKGGASLLLLTPSFESWPEFNDPDYQRYSALRPNTYAMTGGFIRRFIRQLKQQLALNPQGFLSIVSQTEIAAETAIDVAMASAPNKESVASNLASNKQNPLKPTAAQESIIQQVLKLADLPRGVIFLTADRGRGKSVALGLSINALVKRVNLKSDKKLSILVTAPLKRNTENLFSVVNNINANSVDKSLAAVNYIAVDQLIIEAEKYRRSANSLADILIVDEAAAIPLPVLNRLLDTCPRLVFSSTLHGYEGSGRGFILRFQQSLLQRFEQVNCLTLTQPLRWAANDPMEQFFNRLLLLDCADNASNLQADLQGSSDERAKPSVTIRKISAQELLDQEPLLRAVFALLVDAHYQTRPSDLRQLLDVPYLHLWIAEDVSGFDSDVNSQAQIKAVLLACEEGGFADKAFNNDGFEGEPSLLSGIVSGKRRPQGNLLAQSLANHANDKHWCQAASLRVMRIAVDSQTRRQGLGTQLLQTLQIFAQQNHFAYWGSSFGYEPSLLVFWQRQGALAVQVGLHLDKASGMRNLMVVKPLNDRLKAMALSLKNKLIMDLPYWQTSYFKETGFNALQQLQQIPSEQSLAVAAATIRDADRLSLKRFLQDEISYDRVYPALCRLFGQPAAKASWHLSSSSIQQSSSSDDLPLTVASLTLAPDWVALAAAFGINGRRALINAIKAELIQQSLT